MSHGPHADSQRRARGRAVCLAVAVSVILVAACAAPRFDDCEVTCSEGGVCPSGFECSDGEYCYREGGGGGAGNCATQIDASAASDPDGAEAVTGPAESVVLRPRAQPIDARRNEPIVVTGCLSGGQDGRDVAYTESSAEAKSRDVVFPRYDASLAQELELPEEPSELELDIAASFDVDPSGTVSSADGVEVLSTTVPADAFGVFYRQAIEVHHVADLFAVTATGEEYEVGEVAVVDWRFVADLGIGDACPPPPPPPSTLE